MRKFIALFLTFYIGGVLANDLHSHTKGIWAISNKGAMQRWIIIHNLEEARTHGLYHIEVIGHQNTDPVWKIKRLAPHMAITEKALKASIREPLTKGDVYPEAYFSAYQQWQQENNAQGGVICETSVERCMP